MKGKLILGKTFNRPLPKTKQELEAAAASTSAEQEAEFLEQINKRKFQPRQLSSSNKTFIHLPDETKIDPPKSIDSSRVSLIESDEKMMEIIHSFSKSQKKQNECPTNKPDEIVASISPRSAVVLPLPLGSRRKFATETTRPNTSTSTGTLFSPRPPPSNNNKNTNDNTQLHGLLSSRPSTSNNANASTSTATKSALFKRFHGAVVNASQNIGTNDSNNNKINNDAASAIPVPPSLQKSDISSLDGDAKHQPASSFRPPTTRERRLSATVTTPTASNSQDQIPSSRQLVFFKVSAVVSKARNLILSHGAPHEALSLLLSNYSGDEEEEKNSNLEDLSKTGSSPQSKNETVEYFFCSEKNQILVLIGICSLVTFDYRNAERTLHELGSRFCGVANDDDDAANREQCTSKMIQFFSSAALSLTDDDEKSNENNNNNNYLCNAIWFRDQALIAKNVVSYFSSILSSLEKSSASSFAACASRAMPYCTAAAERLMIMNNSSNNKSNIIQNNFSLTKRPNSGSVRNNTGTPFAALQSPLLHANNNNAASTQTKSSLFDSISNLRSLVAAHSKNSCKPLIMLTLIFLRGVCLTWMSKTVLATKTFSAILQIFDEIFAASSQKKGKSSTKNNNATTASSSFLMTQIYWKTWFCSLFADAALCPEILHFASKTVVGGSTGIGQTQQLQEFLIQVAHVFESRECKNNNTNHFHCYLTKIKNVFSNTNKENQSHQQHWHGISSELKRLSPLNDDHSSSPWLSSLQTTLMMKVLTQLIDGHATLENGMSFVNGKISSTKPWFDRMSNILVLLQNNSNQQFFSSSPSSVHLQLRNLMQKEVEKYHRTICDDVWKTILVQHKNNNIVSAGNVTTALIELKFIEILVILQWCHRCVECAKSKRLQCSPSLQLEKERAQQGESTTSSILPILSKSRTTTQFLSAAACLSQTAAKLLEELQNILTSLQEQQRNYDEQQLIDDKTNFVRGDGKELRSLFSSSGASAPAKMSERLDTILEKQNKEDAFLASLLAKSQNARSQTLRSKSTTSNNLLPSFLNAGEEVSNFPSLSKQILKNRWLPLCETLRKNIAENFVVWFCDLTSHHIANVKKDGNINSEEKNDSPSSVVTYLLDSLSGDEDFFDFDAALSSSSSSGGNPSNRKNFSSSSSNTGNVTSEPVMAAEEKQCRQLLLLPVSGEVSKQQISAAFRKRALEWHPDRNPNMKKDVSDEETSFIQQQFVKLNDAYQKMLKFVEK